MKDNSPSVRALISRSALLNNVKILRNCCQAGHQAGVSICPAVKANAYGHGVKIVAPVLVHAGVEALAVAHVKEGLELRALGVTTPVLVFCPPCENHVSEAFLDADLTATLVELPAARALNTLARKMGKRARVHVKVDTGMGRMGPEPEQALTLLRELRQLPNLDVEGLYTHFPVADEPEGGQFVSEQLKQFNALIARARIEGLCPPIIHAANSAATVAFPESHFDRVRPGLSVYGYRPGPGMGTELGLQPILKILARIVFVKGIPPGATVGYGRTFTAQRPTRLGILPLGYEDGYLRRYSNCAQVLVETASNVSTFVPVLGRVSMDQTAIDLTDVPAIAAGDDVTVISNRPADPNSVESLARLAHTIPQDVTCALGNRISRIEVE